MAERPPFDALLISRQAVADATHGDRTAIFRAVVQSALPVMPGADGAFIELCERDEFVLRAGSGLAEAQIGHRRAMLSGAEATIHRDLAKNGSPDLRDYARIGMRSLLSVPIAQGERPLGVLHFFAGLPGAFEEKDLTIARLVGAQIVSGLSAVSERLALQAQMESEARFEAITAALPQLIWTMSRNGRALYCNRRMLDFLGLPDMQGLRGNPFSFIVPEDRERVAGLWDEARRQPEVHGTQCRVQPLNGRARWLQLHVVPVRDHRGKLTEWIGVGVDIDDLKAQEHDLKASLQEVNHRVKNSLQMVVGLLALQASKVANEEARERLFDAREQIATIAQAHQSMYQADDQAHVAFITLLRNLIGGLVDAGRRPRAQVTYDVPEDVVISLDQAVPLSLVVSEIVTNALKHGDKGPEDLHIAIRMQADAERMLIDITDNGRGFPARFQPDQSRGLGMDIIFGLAQQAGGRAEIVPSDAGAHMRLAIPHR